MSTRQPRNRVLDKSQAYQLSCGKCRKSLFVVVVQHDGVIVICQGCFTRYKLEAIGGVKILDA